MEGKSRHDFFEPGDRTALVCVDDAEVQTAVLDQLSGLGFKIHTGFFIEDISLKLKSHVYDTVVVPEHFNDAYLESNPILAEIASVPASQRRHFFVVLAGPGMVTGDEMQAFQHSVDLVVGLADIGSLGVAMQRAVTRRDEFYRVFKECETMAGIR